MLSYLVLALLATSASCSSWHELWKTNPNIRVEVHQFQRFMEEHKRSYVGDEMRTRFELFSQNLRDIERWNKEAKGQTVFGVTEYSDRTLDEKRQLFTQTLPMFNETFPLRRVEKPLVLAATNFDWRDYGVIGSVKNQGQCGSCWAFATASVTEAMAAIYGNGMLNLSEQQMVDCIEGGCNGGNLANAMNYVQSHGLPTETAYPYKAVRGTCSNSAAIAAYVSAVYVLANDESEMLWNLDGYGPLSIGFKVGSSFMNYKSGILTNTDCDTSLIGWHAVTATGYGTDASNTDYWWIKNSWGTSWGQAGYAQLKRNSNWCSINSMPVAADG